MDKMLKVEANFIYQRKGLYEVLLNKIGDKERENSKSQGHDELKNRVASFEAAQSSGFGGGFGGGGFAPQRVTDQKVEEAKKRKEEDAAKSYIDQCLSLYDSMVL